MTHDGPGVPAAQAYGAIFQHSEAVTEADYFGWTIKGPGNGSVNACGADELVIQLGNAQASTGEFAAANSHMTYTVELKDASGQLCGHDLTLAENTRPGQEGANNFGLQTYYIPMSEFSGCSASAISEVAVKVVGGKDAEASASTEGNATFPVFGFIGFTGDNEDACVTGGQAAISDSNTSFSVTVSEGKYSLDGIQGKTLTLKRGYTYHFDTQDASTNSHPLYLGTGSSGGSYSDEYTDGVTNSRTTNGTLTFVIPQDAPNSLYYNCGLHSNMGAKITIVD